MRFYSNWQKKSIQVYFLDNTILIEDYQFYLDKGEKDQANIFTGCPETLVIYTDINSTGEYYANEYGFDFEYRTDNRRPAENTVGDVDRDGYISSKDALLVLKGVAKLIEFEEQEVMDANVNGDEIVNSDDALYILKYIVKVIENFEYVKI